MPPTTRSWSREADSIAAFRIRQQAAFVEEVARWQAHETVLQVAEDDDVESVGEVSGHLISAHMHGSVWKVLVEEGQTVSAGSTVVILEAMKTELAITAPVTGTVRAVYCRPGRLVATGDRLLAIEAG